MFIKMFFKQLKVIDYVYYILHLIAIGLFSADAIMCYQEGRIDSSKLMILVVALQTISFILHFIGDIASTKTLINKEQALKEIENKEE